MSFAILLAVQTAGCNPFEDNGKKIKINPVDGIILFDITELRAPGDDEPSIHLVMNTEKIYKCCNYEILSSVLGSSAEMTVDIEGIGISDICLTALGPASAIKPLDPEPGTFELYFVMGDMTDEYEVTIDGGSITILAVHSEFTRPAGPLSGAL